jgi:Flp pilus assembly pilin Flp
LFRDESGVTAIEYALVGGLASIMILVGVQATGTATRRLFEAVAAAFP